MPGLKHYHTPIKRTPRQYRCAHPDCSWTNTPEMILGQRMICKCGDTFIVTNAELRLKKMHCPDCTRGRVKTPKPVEPAPVLIDNLEDELRKFFSHE